MKIYVVGVGPGAECYLTDYAKKKIIDADLVITTERLFKKLYKLNAKTVCKEISEFISYILQNKDQLESVCILASGDVGFYSISNTLKKKIKDFDMEFISGISSLQYLTAKLKIPYNDIKVVSLHGREENIIPYVCYNKKVFLLTGGKYKVNNVIDQLNTAGLSNVLVTVGENLSYVHEKIITAKANEFKGMHFEDLAAMLIYNENFVYSHKKIYDHEFIRGKSPMTKEAVRTLSISWLNIKPQDAIVDIGAGTGSVSIEMARVAFEGMVLAIEKEDYAVDLIRQNIVKFGAYNVKVIEAQAPEGMDKLSKINKAFIGGSCGNLNAIIEVLTKKSEVTKIVVNAITLKTLNQAIQSLKEYGFTTKIVCVNIAKAESIGEHTMMKAENPIYIISGDKEYDYI